MKKSVWKLKLSTINSRKLEMTDFHTKNTANLRMSGILTSESGL